MSGTLPVTIGETVIINENGITEVELLDLLGVGSFGYVWKVKDRSTKKIYVLKMITGIKPGSLLIDRIKLEASVNIPDVHIIPVLALCQWSASVFLMLFDYYPAISLDKVLEEKKLNNPQKKHIFTEFLLAVNVAHNYNIIHRDLKPGNILISDDFQDVKIIDFGISKFRDANITESGDFLGTLEYMPPEILNEGSKNVDAKTDIYALGHILYELVTGQHFWQKQRWGLDNFIGYVNQYPTPKDAIDLSDFKCDFHPNIKTILSKMVKVNPVERYTNINEILIDLDIIPPSHISPSSVEYPVLIIETGTNKGCLTVINIASGEKVILGRYDIAGDDNSISRKHIELTRKDNNYYVRDVGSKNGTMLAGKYLDDKFVSIIRGNKIKIGDIFLRFE